MSIDDLELKQLKKLKEGDKVLVLHKYVYDYSYHITIETITKKTQGYLTVGFPEYKVSRETFSSNNNGPYVKTIYLLTDENLKILNEKIIKEELLRLKFRIKQFVDEASFDSIKEVYDFMLEKKVLKKVDVKLDSITLK
jgi:phosphopantetheine adenylyltransferase